MAVANSEATRRMPVISDELRSRIFRNIPGIRETILKSHHTEVYAVDLAKAIYYGSITPIVHTLKADAEVRKELFIRKKDPDGTVKLVLRKNAKIVLKAITGFYLDTISRMGSFEHFDDEQFALYQNSQVDVFERKNEKMRTMFPNTFAVVMSTLELLPSIISGEKRDNVLHLDSHG